MTDARLIVCERSTDWAVALRRAAEDCGLRVRETRSLDECWEELARHPASLLVIEVTASNLPALVARLASLARDFPAAAAVVVAARGGRPWETVLREAGAVHVEFSRRRAGRLVALAQRHLGTKSPVRQPGRQAIWERLPWTS